MALRNLCVYCGSSPGRLPDYTGAARDLARVLVERDVGLVYGGASVGLMGALADEVLRRGGRVVGVIPRALLELEVAHARLTELHVTASMHERKSLMAELADGFVALPGGLGTLEELLEIWTWAQLGLHRKPCALLDVAGYYTPLVRFLDHATAEGFIRPAQRDILLVAADAALLVERMMRYEPPELERWLDPGET